jgi:hypothetical protein
MSSLTPYQYRFRSCLGKTYDSYSYPRDVCGLAGMTGNAKASVNRNPNRPEQPVGKEPLVFPFSTTNIDMPNQIITIDEDV